VKALRWFRHRKRRLAIVMGGVDGILTALLLAAGRLLGRGALLDVSLAMRVAVGAMATSGFVFYIARYTELRSNLVYAEAQLNMARRGILATTHLGWSVFRDAMAEAAISGISSFAGASLPLALAILLPSVPGLSISLPLLTLGGLGFTLGKSVNGRPGLWSFGLMLGGLLMALLGFELHLV
jgi:VIT1/CCC1 family predicted Fe2+/Mn2+ transporter